MKFWVGSENLGQERNFGSGTKFWLGSKTGVKLILSQQREIRSSLELSEAVEAEIIA